VSSRVCLLVSVLAAAPLSGCGAYYAYGETMLPYQGDPMHRTTEIDLGLTRPEFPHWAFALSATAARGPHDSATFFEPRCSTGTAAEQQRGKAAGCHPSIFSNSAALEMQYRWRTAHSLRPVASMAVGSLRTTYDYLSREHAAGDDSAQASPFVTLRGGGEFSLAPWVHVALLAGYRDAFHNSSLSKTVSNSGFTVTSLLVIGRRYQARE
jgi:hypothetical protein